MTETTIGIDISKATLDVHRLSDGAAAQFSNDKAGFRALTAWLKGHDIARMVYEPTGPYHRSFEVALEAGFPLVKVNPLQARRFAQSLGTRVKTDAVPSRRCKHRLPGDRCTDAGHDGGCLFSGSTASNINKSA